MYGVSLASLREVDLVVSLFSPSLLVLGAVEVGAAPPPRASASFNLTMVSSETYCRSFQRPIRSSNLRVCFGQLS